MNIFMLDDSNLKAIYPHRRCNMHILSLYHMTVQLLKSINSQHAISIFKSFYFLWVFVGLGCSNDIGGLMLMTHINNWYGHLVSSALLITYSKKCLVKMLNEL